MFYINMKNNQCPCEKQIIVLRRTVYKEEEMLHVLSWKKHQHVRQKQKEKATDTTDMESSCFFI